MNAAAFWAPLGLAAGIALAAATAPKAEPMKACCKGVSDHPPEVAITDAGGADMGSFPTQNALPAALLAVPMAGSAAGAVVATAGFRIGVVIYSFEQGKRSKAMAKALAEKSVEIARNDFVAAVKAGDSDSDADYGTFSPHSFDADVESAVLDIPIGQVGGPIETSRGYWIVKRIK